MDRARILYVGPLWLGGTSLQRVQAMESLGYQITSIDTEPEEMQEKKKRFVNRVMQKLFGATDLINANQRLLQLVSNNFFDFLWLDKALTISPETLKTVKQTCPKTIIVGYSPDDMAAKHNQSRNFLNTLYLYNVFFTSKSYGVEELMTLGAKQVNFIGNSYDPSTHRPVKVTTEEKLKIGGSVGFIGDYENERAQSMYFLSDSNIQVRIWGPNWNKKCHLNHPNMIIEGRPLWGDEYARAICSFKINLVFLRKINRDLQTTRSIEIPACGGFMLAERTNEHLELFEEGKEAEFFDTNEELHEKVKYYLQHDEKRTKIANAGRERCLKSGYSNHDRMKEMFHQLKDL